MKRKITDTPTRIYSYRCLPPLTEQPRVEDQFLLAHRFRNTLVEIEHRLRDRFRQVQIDDPVVGPALVLYQDADGGVENAIEDLRAAKSGVAHPDLTAHCERLEAAKDLRREAYEGLRTAKTTRADDLRPRYDEARAQSAAEAKAARQDYSRRGLRHGAYRRVEDAVKQAAASTKVPLSFKRYEGTGSIGTQLVETGVGVRDSVDPDVVAIGMTWPELISCRDPRLQLGPPGATDKHPRAEVAAVNGSWADAMKLPRNVRRHAARTYIDLRIGSNPDRSPIFARFPVTLHRLPPKDSVIKWAYIVRRRIGYHYEWRFQLTLESKTFDKPPVAIGQGTCAVNLGWRQLFDDQGEVIGIRAAYVVDEDSHERQIRVPDHHGRAVMGAIGKCDDLAQIRDKALERALGALSSWLTTSGMPDRWTVAPAVTNPGEPPPKTKAERLRGHAQWRATWKLRRFMDQWAKDRVPGDEEIFTVLVAWAKQDRHLESWQAHQREKIIARRRETWRVIATELARTYATILVGEGKLTEVEGWDKKAPEDGDPHEGREQRRAARIAAPGELRAEIHKAAAKTGAKVVLCDEKYATQECAACGHDTPWDARPKVTHTCEDCGAPWDQDANYCRNLLKRHGVSNGRSKAAKVLASNKRVRSKASSGSATQAAWGPEPA